MKKRDIRIAVLSNKQDKSTKLASERFFGNLIDFSVGGRSAIPLKPNKEAASSIFAHFSISEEETAYIGDSEVDVKTAENIGVPLKIAVDWGYRSREELIIAGARTIVSSPGEILEIIDSANNSK